MVDIDQHADNIANLASKATFGGAAWTIFSSLTLDSISTILGIVVSIIGLLVMWYYKNKAFKLEEAARLREVEAIEKYYREKPPEAKDKSMIITDTQDD